MLSLYTLHRHHHSIGTIVVIMLFTLYHQIITLPPAFADTVTILVDNDGTEVTAEIPCGSPSADNGDCTLNAIFGSSGYLASYLSVPAHQSNQQFHIVVADHVHQISTKEPIAIQFPAPCTNCTLEIDGGHSDSSKTIIVPIINNDSHALPTTALSLSNNSTPVVIENFSIQGFTTTGIAIENISTPTININNNSFGALTSSSGSNGHAISVTNSANVVIDHNIFGGHSSDALVLSGEETTNTRVSNNLFGVQSSSDLNHTLPAINANALAISDHAHDNSIDGNNIFAGAHANGIRIIDSNNNTVAAGNRFFNNTDQSIALINAANNNIAAPTVTSAQKQGSNLIVSGQGVSGSAIHFYRASNTSSPHIVPDTVGGEGFAFLNTGSIDGSGDHNPISNQFEFSLAQDIDIGESVTAFQTSSLNSSEFSNNVAITSAPVPPPTSTGTPTPTATPTPTTPPPVPSTPAANVSPIANAGPNQTVNPSANVHLNAALSSDPDGNALSYHWEQSASDHYQVALTSASSVNASFIAPIVAELQASLHFTVIVSDGHGGTDTDTTTVTITRNHTAPIANLQILPDARVAPGTEIILDGGDSTFDSGTVTRDYSFRAIQSSGSEIHVTINQSSPHDPQARVIIPGGLTRETSFTFELTVGDGIDTSSPVQQTVRAVPQASSTQLCTNEDPVANAGRNQNITRPVGTIITLNGQNSHDPSNTLLTYSWRQIPGGVTVSLNNPTSAVANFAIPVLTTVESSLSFELTVTNHCGRSDTATTRVKITNNDLDNDSLDNARETELGTDPTKADTDNDGINDGAEILSSCMSPLNPDSDNDGVHDGQEDLNHNGITDGGETNPCIADTDIDTLPDGFESKNGLNALNPNDAEQDGDNDGLSNREEFIYKTDPRNPDSDHDGLKDGTEIKSSSRTSPINDDTDSDGILDGNEDINHNGLADPGETNPTIFDTDRDGLNDGQEIGIATPQTKNTDLSKFRPDLDPLTKTSPLNPDTDGDGLIDGKEDANHNGSWDCGETDPMNSQNKVKLCGPTPTATATPTVTKQARTLSGISIQVQKSSPVTQNVSNGLVQLVSPAKSFSISVTGGSSGTQQSTLTFTVPASIMVLPAILPSTGVIF